MFKVIVKEIKTQKEGQYAARLTNLKESVLNIARGLSYDLVSEFDITYMLSYKRKWAEAFAGRDKRAEIYSLRRYHKLKFASKNPAWETNWGIFSGALWGGDPSATDTEQSEGIKKAMEHEFSESGSDFLGKAYINPTIAKDYAEEWEDGVEAEFDETGLATQKGTPAVKFWSTAFSEFQSTDSHSLESTVKKAGLVLDSICLTEYPKTVLKYGEEYLEKCVRFNKLVNEKGLGAIQAASKLGGGITGFLADAGYRSEDEYANMTFRNQAAIEIMHARDQIWINPKSQDDLVTHKLRIVATHMVEQEIKRLNELSDDEWYNPNQVYDSKTIHRTEKVGSGIDIFEGKEKDILKTTWAKEKILYKDIDWSDTAMSSQKAALIKLNIEKEKSILRDPGLQSRLYNKYYNELIQENIHESNKFNPSGLSEKALIIHKRNSRFETMLEKENEFNKKLKKTEKDIKKLTTKIQTIEKGLLEISQPEELNKAETQLAQHNTKISKLQQQVVYLTNKLKIEHDTVLNQQRVYESNIRKSRANTLEERFLETYVLSGNEQSNIITREILPYQFLGTDTSSATFRAAVDVYLTTKSRIDFDKPEWFNAYDYTTGIDFDNPVDTHIRQYYRNLFPDDVPDGDTLISTFQINFVHAILTKPEYASAKSEIDLFLQTGQAPQNKFIAAIQKKYGHILNEQHWEEYDDGFEIIDANETYEDPIVEYLGNTTESEFKKIKYDEDYEADY